MNSRPQAADLGPADADQADAVAAWLKTAMLDAMAPLIAPVLVEVEVKVGTTWEGAD